MAYNLPFEHRPTLTSNQGVTAGRITCQDRRPLTGYALTASTLTKKTGVNAPAWDGLACGLEVEGTEERVNESEPRRRLTAIRNATFYGVR